MINIDRRGNITMDVADNAILDIKPCGCDFFKPGDEVHFRSEEQNVVVTNFIDGIAKVYLGPSNKAFNGNYCVYVVKKDGRQEAVCRGKYIREGGCL